MSYTNTNENTPGDDRPKRGFLDHGNNKNGSRAFTGLILITIGAALLLRNMDFPFIPEWIFSWPMILVVIGIYSGIRNNFRNTSWFILVALGGFFLLDEYVPGLTKEAFFWPVVIMALGVLFVLRPKREHWTNCAKDEDRKLKDDFNRSGFTVAPDAGTHNSEDYINTSSVFSGVNRKILSKNFQGGSISCIFGGTEVDLTQADINGRVVIKIDEVFGGIKLKVPPDWVVQNEINGVFHGVDERRNPQSFAANPAKTLVLKGSCVFAGIEIRSY